MRRKSDSSGTWLLAIIAICLLILTPAGRSLLSSLEAAIQAASSSSSSLSLFNPSTSTGGCAYSSLIRQDADAAGIPENYFLRQIMRESKCDPNALGADGEEGIAQFTPAKAREVNLGNPYDPTAALLAASHVMSGYQHQFGGDYAKALAAYNAGPGRVQTASSQCGTSWMTCLSEAVHSTGTRDYVNAILYG